MQTKEVTKQKRSCVSWETWRDSGDKGISLKILNRKIFLQINVSIVSQARQDLCRGPEVLRHVVHGNGIPENVHPVRQKPFLTTLLITTISFFHLRLF